MIRRVPAYARRARRRRSVRPSKPTPSAQQCPGGWLRDNARDDQRVCVYPGAEVVSIRPRREPQRAERRVGKRLRIRQRAARDVSPRNEEGRRDGKRTCHPPGSLNPDVVARTGGRSAKATDPKIPGASEARVRCGRRVDDASSQETGRRRDARINQNGVPDERQTREVDRAASGDHHVRSHLGKREGEGGMSAAWQGDVG